MRIVSLLPSATELLFAVGAGAEVVGVTHECDAPPEAAGLPALTRNLIASAGAAGPGAAAAIDRHIRAAVHAGSGIYGLDEQRLAELRPDLVVTQELCEVCAVSYRVVARAVRRIDADIPVLSLEPESLDDIIATARAVGHASGHEAEGARLAASLRARIDAVSAQPAPDPRPVVACIEWTDPLMAGGHWVPEMVRVAGGTDALGRVGARSEVITWESVVAARPDLMVLMPCGFDLAQSLALAPDITSREGFDTLPCARSGRVVAVDGSGLFNRPGPRIVEGLALLATIMRATPGSPLPPGAAWVDLPTHVTAEPPR